MSSLATAGMISGSTLIAALTLGLAGCGGGGGESGGAVPPPPPPPVVLRPPVEKASLDGLQSRDFHAGERGTGFAYVCPGADDRQGPRSFLIHVSGLDLERVNEESDPDELDSICRRHATTSNYHLVVNQWSNGADYIQRNAGVIRDLIETMIEDYEIDAGDRVAIVGESMGGVVVRYALQQMESEGVAHHVDRFVSVDSPQKGAYVPIGTQHIAAMFAEFGGQAQLDFLDTPAARQMLLYHYSRGGDAQTWHDLFGELYYDQLQGVLGGFPRAPGLRTVGVSSGRISGGFEHPLPGTLYYDGTLTLRRTVNQDYEFRFPFCNTDFEFSVKVEAMVDAQVWALGFSGSAQPGLSTVARRKIRAEIDDIPVSDRNGLTDHFVDLAIAQLPGACRTVAGVLSGIGTEIARPLVDLSIGRAMRLTEEEFGDFIDMTVSVPVSFTVTEGAAGGTSDAIGQMRDALKAANFTPKSLGPGIGSKSTNLFIPLASALMLDGVNPADPLTEETVRAASAFDQVYFETESDQPHLDSSTRWFEEEVLALFNEGDQP